MKKSIDKLFVLVLIIGILSVAAFSQTRIRFARGQSSATVKGKLQKGGGRCFILGARSGQWIEAGLSSGNGRVSFWSGLMSGADPLRGETSYSKTADNGDNEICIENLYRASTFTLKVSIK